MTPDDPHRTAPFPSVQVPSGQVPSGEGQVGAQPPALVPTEPAPASPAERPVVRTYRLSFSGTAGEYFRVWAVNAALTVLTLGLYAPWARVRNRQYLYGHTWLDGHNFEYAANPAVLLRSYLVVALLFLLYNVALEFEFSGSEWVIGLLLLLFGGFYPWLVRQSMRFQARSTTHRGLSFQFVGSVGGAYKAYALTNFAAALSGGLTLPWAWYAQRRYQAEGLVYGQARGHFRGELGEFYLIGLRAVGFSVALLLGLGLLAYAAFALGGGDALEEWLPEVLGQDPEKVMVGVFVAAGLLGALVYTAVWQYVRAATMAYVLTQFELGGVVRTRALFRPWRLVWIGVTNLLARVLTLGLLTPWAVIRANRYVLENVEVRTIATLDGFSAGEHHAESGLGEAVTDLMGIDIGF